MIARGTPGAASAIIANSSVTSAVLIVAPCVVEDYHRGARPAPIPWEFASTRDGFDSPTRKLDRELLANAVPPELPLVDIQNDRGRADFRALLNCRPIPRCLARASWICVLTGRWSRILLTGRWNGMRRGDGLGTPKCGASAGRPTAGGMLLITKLLHSAAAICAAAVVDRSRSRLGSLECPSFRLAARGRWVRAYRVVCIALKYVYQTPEQKPNIIPSSMFSSSFFQIRRSYPNYM